MNDLIKKINLNKCLLLFVYAFIFCVLLFFNQFYVTHMSDDSIDITMFPQKVYHGKYIVSLLLHITYGLVPTLFNNIHINTWGQTGGAVLYSIFFIMLMSSLSSLFFIKNKKNYLYPLIILINFIIFYYVFSMQHFHQHYYYLYSKTLFCYFLFPFTFLFLFMKKILTLLLNETKPEKKDIFELSLYSFLIGFSTDVLFIFTFVFLVILLCFKSKFKNITFGNILITASSLIIPFYISSCRESFEQAFSIEKLLTALSSGLGNVLEILKELNVVFIDVFKQEYCILFLIVLFLSFLILLTTRKRNTSYNFFNFMLIITIILYGYSLFFISIGYLHADNYTGLIGHRDFVFESKLFLLMMINIQAGFLLKDIKHNKKLLIIVSVFFACLSYKYLIHEIKFINDVGIKNYLKEKTHIAEIKEKHKNRYILEHILLWYLYNDKPPVILYWNDYFCRYWTLGHYFYFRSYFNYEKYNERDIEFFDTLDEVVKKYYENGGREITEAEINKADFNKLLDKDWVLYGDK